jgi:hypothetical protein
VIERARVPSNESPFRSEDLASRVAALRAEHDALTNELARTRAALRHYRPWSWLRFALGVIAPLLAIVLAGWLAR